MRPDLHIIQQIEKYLSGKMTADQRLLFEAEMHANPELERTVEQQKLITERIAQKAFMAEVAAFHEGYVNIPNGGGGFNGKTLFNKWIFGGAIAVAVIGTAAWWANSTKADDEVAVHSPVDNMRHVASEAKGQTSSREEVVIENLDSEIAMAVKQPKMTESAASQSTNQAVAAIEPFEERSEFNEQPALSVATDVAIQDSSLQHLAKVLAPLGPKPQRFTISTAFDTTIVGKAGTRVTIPKHVFVAKGGAELAEQVTITMTEYYTVQDIVLANLSTASNKELIETGGMVHITAVDKQGRDCEIAQGKSIDLVMASQKAEGGRFQTFEGEVEEGGNMNWIVQGQMESERRPERRAFKVDQEVDQAPTPASTYLFENLQNVAKYSVDDYRRKVEGTVVVRATIDTEGNLVDPHIVQSLTPEMDERAYCAVKQLKNWTPAQVDGQAVITDCEFPVNYELPTPDKVVPSLDGDYKARYQSLQASPSLGTPGYIGEPWQTVELANHVNIDEAVYRGMFFERDEKFNLTIDQYPLTAVQSKGNLRVRVCLAIDSLGTVTDGWVVEAYRGGRQSRVKHIGFGDRQIKLPDYFNPERRTSSPNGPDSILHKMVLNKMLQTKGWTAATFNNQPVSSYRQINVDLDMGKDIRKVQRNRAQYSAYKEAALQYEQKIANDSIKYFSKNGVQYANYANGQLFEKGQIRQIFDGQKAQWVAQNAISTTSLGWINCDRFLGTVRPLIAYELERNSMSLNTRYMCVFHRINSVMPAYSLEGGGNGFPNVPNGYDVTVIAIKAVGEQLFLGQYEGETSRQGAPPIPMEPVSTEDLLTFLEGLQPNSRLSSK